MLPKLLLFHQAHEGGDTGLDCCQFICRANTYKTLTKARLRLGDTGLDRRSTGQQTGVTGRSASVQF